MSILDLLSQKETWEKYREDKICHSLLAQKEIDRLDDFLMEKRYLPVTESLTFSIPEKRKINKGGTGKKRIVYTYPDDENQVLKLLTYLLYRYDDYFHQNLYSFRRNHTARKAFIRLLRIPDLQSKYVLKIDIHDYFNSMPSKLLVKEFEKVITDDSKLLQFLCDFYLRNEALEDGVLVKEDNGAMAGVPLSAFCANLYLSDLDGYFEEKGIPYFRYSDDIIVLSDSKEERDSAYSIIIKVLNEKGLQINPDKLSFSDPKEPFDFLGFRYENGRVDLAKSTITKMKAKIKRKAKALYRWKIRKNADYDRTAKAMIRTFNQKFYDLNQEFEFTWSRWFFPVLTTDKGLHELDDYLVNHLRYLNSGRYYKGNYQIDYAHLKELGYRSLVHEYYQNIKEKK